MPTAGVRRLSGTKRPSIEALKKGSGRINAKYTTDDAELGALFDSFDTDGSGGIR